jgi:hypothetical protein
LFQNTLPQAAQFLAACGFFSPGIGPKKTARAKGNRKDGEEIQSPAPSCTRLFFAHGQGFILAPTSPASSILPDFHSANRLFWLFWGAKGGDFFWVDPKKSQNGSRRPDCQFCSDTFLTTVGISLVNNSPPMGIIEAVGERQTRPRSHLELIANGNL